MSLKVLLSKLADIISAVEFDHTGDYLATGDRGGRVVLFERNEGVSCIN
jgi:serine/threonine-protein phosphatase 2A regulatory subunit B